LVNFNTALCSLNKRKLIYLRYVYKRMKMAVILKTKKLCNRFEFFMDYLRFVCLKVHSNMIPNHENIDFMNYRHAVYLPTITTVYFSSAKTVAGPAGELFLEGYATPPPPD
jgi:hypothetical protein